MAFGIEVYAPNGNTIISISSRVARFAQQGTFTSTANSTVTINVPNMQNNDSWDVFLTQNTGGIYSGIKYSLNTGFFSVRNTSTTNTPLVYWVVRS